MGKVGREVRRGWGDGEIAEEVPPERIRRSSRIAAQEPVNYRRGVEAAFEVVLERDEEEDERELSIPTLERWRMERGGTPEVEEYILPLPEDVKEEVEVEEEMNSFEEAEYILPDELECEPEPEVDRIIKVEEIVEEEEELEVMVPDKVKLEPEDAEVMQMQLPEPEMEMEMKVEVEYPLPAEVKVEKEEEEDDTSCLIQIVNVSSLMEPEPDPEPDPTSSLSSSSPPRSQENSGNGREEKSPAASSSSSSAKPPLTSLLLPTTLLTQTETLATQLNSLMREKEIWEESRHGFEIISLSLRYFQNNEDAYGGYISRLEELISVVVEDYSCYLPVEALLTRPVLLCVYFVERVCAECGCCGGGMNNGGTTTTRKVNFSPVLDNKRSSNNLKQKQQGDTSLDPPSLTKLHTLHLLLTRLLDPYHKTKGHLLTLSKVQELAREMDGLGSGLISSGCGGGGGDDREYYDKSSQAGMLLTLTGEFYRQGILLKLNKRKGLQNRIFFLFRNALIYGTRLSSTQGFRLHGLILTRNMELLDSSQMALTSIPYSFSLIVKSDSSQHQNGTSSPTTNSPPSPNEKILILAAFTQQDHELWVKQVGRAIRVADRESSSSSVLVAKLFNSSEELLNQQQQGQGGRTSCGGGGSDGGGSRVEINACHNRSNALSHVCWHRNISIDAGEVVEKEKHQISGPLLRKFKNSPGWQRLWVVFTHSCLYFYKNANETIPLASLPLLGYKIELLSEEERTTVTKEHVFKLVFKAHVYYFRAESGYTFGRWVGVLRNNAICGGNVISG